MQPQQVPAQERTFSTWQQLSIITSTLIGVGVLTLPRTSSAILKEAGWLGPALGAVISWCSIALIAWLGRRFIGMTFIQYTPIVWGSKRLPWLGKWLGLPWVLIFLASLFCSTAATSRIFGEVVVTAVLLDTPLEAILITMFLLALILCMHEVEVLARVNEVLIPLIVLPVLFIALTSFQNANWNNLMPFYSSSWSDLWGAVLETTFSYQGYELMLIFFAFSRPGCQLGRASGFGIGLAAFVYTLIVLAGIVVFGYEELQRVTWPTLELVKNTQVPGLILERLESAFLAVWVAAVFTTVGNTYYGFIYGLRQLFGRGIVFQRISAAVLLIPLCYIALIPQNITDVFQVAEVLGYTGLIVTTFLPLIYVLVTLVRYGWKDRSEKSNETPCR